MTLILCINSIRAKEPQLLGRVEMPSLTGFLNNVSPFMEKLSPGSSAKLILGATALAFAPDFKDFDVTQPLALYIYAGQSEKKTEPYTVIVVSKKTEKLPARMQITGQQLYTKTFGDKVMLSESQEILNSIPALPAPLKTNDNQISASFHPAEYIKRFPQDFQEIRREIVKQIASAGKRRLDVNGIKILNLKLAYAEKAIQQLETISLTISADKEIVNIALSFKAENDSAFTEFIAAQKKSETPCPSPASSKLISAAGRIEMTEPLRKILSEIAEGIAVEEADDESDMKYVSTLQLLFKTFEGSLSFYMDNVPSRNDARFSLTTLTMQDSKAAAAVLESLSKTSKQIDGNTYSLTSVFIGPQTESKLICSVDKNKVIMLSGPLSDKEALEQLSVNKESKSENSGPACIALIGKENPSEGQIDFRDGCAVISLKLTPETLKPVLPDAPLLNTPTAPAKQPGQKKNKKKRIQLNPADFIKPR